jgi:hypothetical protein
MRRNSFNVWNEFVMFSSRDTTCLCCEHKTGSEGSYAIFIKVNRKFPFPIFCELAKLAKSPCKTRNGILNQLVACCCRLQTFISRLFRFFTSPQGNDEHIFLALIFLPCSPATGSLQGDLTASVVYVILLGKKNRFRRILKRAEEFNRNICASVCSTSNPSLRLPRLVFFSCGTSACWRTRDSHYQGFAITLRHTALRRTPLDERSARYRDFYLITSKIHERQTFSLTAGFEPIIPVSKRPQTHALDHAATGNGSRPLWLFSTPKYPVTTELYRML